MNNADEKKAVNPRGVELIYRDEPHTYETKNVRAHDFTSVTTFVGTLFPKFDEDTISKKCALKRGVTQEEVLKEWHDKRDKACDFGTRVHEMCENYILGNDISSTVMSDEEKPFFMSAYKYIYDKIISNDNLKVIEAEKIVFSEGFKLAGTIDLLLYDKEQKKVVILDWKTNKKLDFSNNFNQYGLYPIDDMDDTNYNHYKVQLNIYRTLLELEGYFPANTEYSLKIVHITSSCCHEYLPEIMESKTKDLLIKKVVEYV